MGTAEGAGSQIPLADSSCPVFSSSVPSCAPYATLVDPRDLPGAPGTFSWQVTHSPGGPGQNLELVYLPPLTLPLTARLWVAHMEEPRFPFPGFRSVLIPLHCPLASWKAGHLLIYKLVSSLTSLSPTAHYCSAGVSSPPPLANSTPAPPQCKASVWSLLGLAKKLGGGGPAAFPEPTPPFLWHRKREH